MIESIRLHGRETACGKTSMLCNSARVATYREENEPSDDSTQTFLEPTTDLALDIFDEVPTEASLVRLANGIDLSGNPKNQRCSIKEILGIGRIFECLAVPGK